MIASMTARNGMAARNTPTRRELIRSAMSVAHTSMTGARTMMRITIMKAIWTLLTSEVSLITREAVLNRSVLEKENPWIFPKRPRRISLPNPMLAMEENREETAPQTRASNAINTISAPVFST